MMPRTPLTDERPTTNRASIKAAAMRVGVPEAQIHRAIAAGELECEDVAGIDTVDIDDVRQLELRLYGNDGPSTAA